MKEVGPGARHTALSSGKTVSMRLLTRKFCELEGVFVYPALGVCDSWLLRDRVSATDVRRLADGEITLCDFAYKYFAFLPD